MCRRLTWAVQTSEKSPLRRGHLVHRGQLEVPRVRACIGRGAWHSHLCIGSYGMLKDQTSGLLHDLCAGIQVLKVIVLAGQACCLPGSHMMDATTASIMHRIGQHVLTAEKRMCQDR